VALPGYISFAREDWAKLRSNTPLTLSEDDLTVLRGLNERTSLAEVVDIYLPLSRLLNLQVRAAHHLSGVKDAFLGRLAGSRPYVIAIAGSVAVGKSTLARILQALMARWPVVRSRANSASMPARIHRKRAPMSISVIST
jgi:type I pantothenate kinase